MIMDTVGNVFKYGPLLARKDSHGAWVAWVDEGEVPYYVVDSCVHTTLRIGGLVYYGPNIKFKIGDKWITLNGAAVYDATDPDGIVLQQLNEIATYFFTSMIPIQKTFHDTNALMRHRVFKLGCDKIYDMLKDAGALTELHDYGDVRLALVRNPVLGTTWPECLTKYKKEVNNLYKELGI